MRQPLSRLSHLLPFPLLSLLLMLCLSLVSPSLVMADMLDEVIASDHREAAAARDRYRHPRETLDFFEVKPDMTVVEIWPGGQGWYTEILAPYLRDQGQFYAAHFNADASAAYFRDARQQFQDKLQAAPALYDRVIVTSFNPPTHLEIAPTGSVDRVLTFRNVHNWYMRGGGDERVLSAFAAFYTALKPGGILGVVEHRLPEDRPRAEQASSGYMHEAYVIRMAEQAGFTLLDQSDINANPADNAQHPHGVWTLPPTLRVEASQRSHYDAIGESDRMTLKFVKAAP